MSDIEVEIVEEGSACHACGLLCPWPWQSCDISREHHPRRRVRGKTIRQDRDELKGRLATEHRRLSAKAASCDGLSSYDWNKSTRDNYQSCPSSDPNYGRHTAPYAMIRNLIDQAYHGVYTVDRQSVQDALIAQVLDKSSVKHLRPWIVFTAGAMGSGKSHTMSWLSEQGIFPLSNIVQIDPDLFRAALPEFEGYCRRDPLTAGGFTRQETGMCCEIAQEAAMRMRKHIWVDGSLRDGEWYLSLFKAIRAKHPMYRIAIFHVSTDADCARARALERAKSTGRHVPESELTNSLERVPIAVKLLSPHADFVVKIDNTGTTPKLIEWHSQELAESSVSLRPVQRSAQVLGSDWHEISRRFANVETDQSWRIAWQSMRRSTSRSRRSDKKTSSRRSAQ